MIDARVTSKYAKIKKIESTRSRNYPRPEENVEIGAGFS